MDSSEDTFISSGPGTARLRSGTAARLAGLPVTTLRVWERRYGVVAAPKTATGQRLYSALDVQRLGLLKQLTDRGHAIGTIAALPLPELQTLAQGFVPAATRARRVLVVGRTAALRLRGLAGCDVVQVHDDADAALAALASQGSPGDPAGVCEVLLVQQASLQPADLQRLPALRRACGAGTALVVLYAFGAEALAESLRAGGATMRREPANGRDLARLVADTHATLSPEAPVSHAAETVPGRRYSDVALVTLAQMPTQVACECPRHIAEIVMQLAGFESYSADCMSSSPADAALHRRLNQLAGQARFEFERALAQVMAAEGIELPG